MFNRLKAKHFAIEKFHPAEAILVHDMPEAAIELEEVLDATQRPVEEIIRGRGN